MSKAVIDLGVQTSAVGFLYLEQALLILLTHQGTCLMSKDVYAAYRGPERYYGAMR